MTDKEITYKEMTKGILAIKCPQYNNLSEQLKEYIDHLIDNPNGYIINSNGSINIDKLWDSLEYEINADRATRMLFVGSPYTIEDFINAGTDIKPIHKDPDYESSIRDINRDRVVDHEIFYCLKEYSELEVEERDKVFAFILYNEITLGQLENIDIEDIEDNLISYDGQDWKVYTDSEADEEQYQYYESSLEETLYCIFKDYTNMRYYFNEDRWIQDCIRYESRGQVLASQDGEEHEQQVFGKWYFLYKV